MAELNIVPFSTRRNSMFSNRTFANRLRYNIPIMNFFKTMQNPVNQATNVLLIKRQNEGKIRNKVKESTTYSTYTSSLKTNNELINSSFGGKKKLILRPCTQRLTKNILPCIFLTSHTSSKWKQRVTVKRKISESVC